jgi:hypothetical protein
MYHICNSINVFGFPILSRVNVVKVMDVDDCLWIGLRKQLFGCACHKQKGCG